MPMVCRGQTTDMGHGGSFGAVESKEAENALL